MCGIAGMKNTMGSQIQMVTSVIDVVMRKKSNAMCQTDPNFPMEIINYLRECLLIVQGFYIEESMELWIMDSCIHDPWAAWQGIPRPLAEAGSIISAKG